LDHRPDTGCAASALLAELERLQRERSIGVSDALNELARAGMVSRSKPRQRFVPVAHAWLSERLNGTRRVAMPWQSLGAFARIATQ
jgi:hypothetical protein